jgi:hypothetical protein
MASMMFWLMRMVNKAVVLEPPPPPQSHGAQAQARAPEPK